MIFHQLSSANSVSICAILSLLELNELPIKVVFKANLKKWSGRHNFGPRYYATHVQLLSA